MHKTLRMYEGWPDGQRKSSMAGPKRFGNYQEPTAYLPFGLLFALWLPAIRPRPLVCAKHSIKRVLRLTMLLNVTGEIKDMHYWQGCKGTGGCNW